MIELQDFDENDFKQLINEIPDSRFLLQWAGPKYSYPLNKEQLKDTAQQSSKKQPLLKAFKAIDTETNKTIGHVQLLEIDHEDSSCTLSRVLVFSKYRSIGLGKKMVSSVVEYAFVTLGVTNITLGVFDFNNSAIATYEKIGFIQFRVDKGARQYQNEKWNIIRMELCLKHWQDNSGKNI